MTSAAGAQRSPVEAPPLTAAVDLRADFDAPRQARNRVGDTLQHWHLGDLDWVYEVLLVTSELVTDAVSHGGNRLRLELTLAPSHLTLSVSDGRNRQGPLPAAEARPDEAQGLAIVEAIADRWGVEHPADGGTRVWAWIGNPPL